MSNAMIATLKYAVENRLPLSLNYDGYPRGVSPYLLGIKNNGDLVVHVLQHAGMTSRGPIEKPEWKFFDVEKIENLIAGSVPGFVVAELKKIEGPYVAPKFIKEIIALHPKE